MQTIKVKDLEIYDVIDHTTYAYLTKCEYNGKTMCLKEILTSRLNKVINNIKLYDKFEMIDGLVIPKYIVKGPFGPIGYLTDNIDDCHTLGEKNDYSFSSKVDILFDAKEKLDKMHNEYNIIHGDLHTRNICYNNKGSYIIDFDNAGKNPDKEHLTMLAKKYIEKNGLDKSLDTFMFNVSTYAFLNDINFSDVEYSIEDYRGCFNTKESIKILNKMKKLRKENEYLIDHV